VLAHPIKPAVTRPPTLIAARQPRMPRNESLGALRADELALGSPPPRVRLRDLLVRRLANILGRQACSFPLVAAQAKTRDRR